MNEGLVPFVKLLSTTYYIQPDIMMKLTCVVLVSLLLSTGSSKACDTFGNLEDEVFVIPGYPQSAPPTRWFSGYLDYQVAGQQVHTHYILQQAELDEANEKPLIYWSSE